MKKDGYITGQAETSAFMTVVNMMDKYGTGMTDKTQVNDIIKGKEGNYDNLTFTLEETKTLQEIIQRNAEEWNKLYQQKKWQLPQFLITVAKYLAGDLKEAIDQQRGAAIRLNQEDPVPTFPSLATDSKVKELLNSRALLKVHAKNIEQTLQGKIVDYVAGDTKKYPLFVVYLDEHNNQASIDASVAGIATLLGLDKAKTSVPLFIEGSTTSMQDYPEKCTIEFEKRVRTQSGTGLYNTLSLQHKLQCLYQGRIQAYGSEDATYLQETIKITEEDTRLRKKYPSGNPINNPELGNNYLNYIFVGSMYRSIASARNSLKIAMSKEINSDLAILQMGTLHYPSLKEAFESGKIPTLFIMPNGLKTQGLRGIQAYTPKTWSSDNP